MSLQVGVLMDPIEDIKTYKDTSFAMILSAQERNHKVFYLRPEDLYVEEGQAMARCRQIHVKDQQVDYYQLGEELSIHLADLDVILMRKDPPFNMEYIYASYVLEMAEVQGALVLNPPAALRTVNEKFYINYLPQCSPKTLVCRDPQRILDFVAKVGKAVLKPLDSMGGEGIFQLRHGDSNNNVIIESLGLRGQRSLMVQAFIVDVQRGDKRIIMIDGEPVSHGLLRIPKEGEFRANLAAGGHGVVEELSKRERWLCSQASPLLKHLGLIFVGLDVIGGYITEINVTSPTCLREIAAATQQDLGALFWEKVEARHGRA